MTILSIANEYGNVDLTRTKLTKRYVHVRGLRLQPLCRKLGIRYAEAVVKFRRRRSGYWTVVTDGVVISARSEQKLRCEIEAREERNLPLRTQRRERRRKRLSDAGISDPNSRRAKWFERGEISAWEAKLIEFKSYYRHEHTDYDATIHRLRLEAESCRGDERRDRFESLQRDAREEMGEFDVPDTWDDYLQAYDFPYPDVAKQLAAILRSPIESHPNWFCEAILAVVKAELDLEGLDYFGIRDAINSWRDERYQ